MNFLQVFASKKIVIYRFLSQNSFQESQINDCLSYLKIVFEYQIIKDLALLSSWNHPDVVIIFLVTCQTNFEQIKNLESLNQSLNLIAYYVPDEEFTLINQKTFRLPIQTQNFFIIHPTEKKQGLIYPDPRKIIDTIIFKTIRTKYQGKQMETNVSDYLNRNMTLEIQEIQKIGAYYEEKNLNPDGKAGAIAMRVNGGILINAANTHKSQITPERISLILDYNLETNTVTWVGNHFPSSESGVAWLAFLAFPNAHYFLHFHCKKMTYSTSVFLEKYRTSRYVHYGTSEEAITLQKQLQQQPNFAIAHGHGEFLISANLQEAYDIINEIEIHLKKNFRYVKRNLMES